MMSIKIIIVLISTIFFAIRYDLEQKTEFCSVDELKESIDNNSFVQLNNKKIDMVFDYQKFNSQCHEINLLLAKYGYFLRVFELKGKFHHLTLKIPKKQNIVRQLSSCINEKYNGFYLISIEYNKKLRKKIKPIDIIYKPVKSLEKKIQCYYSQDIFKS